MRKADLSRLSEAGEPCAMKVASTVRGGADGKGLHKRQVKEDDKRKLL